MAQELIIPDGIKYEVAPESINNKAQEIINKELSEPSFNLFDGLLYCGPQLWDRLNLIPKMSSIEKGNIKFRVPDGNVITERLGKLIQNQEDFNLVWSQIVNDFKGTNFEIRKLTTSELQYFWAIIFYDIEEPLFVVENDKYKLALDFNKNKLKLLFIEAL